MVLEDEARPPAPSLALEKQRSSQPADAASHNRTVVDFAGIHDAGGHFVVRVIPDLVAVRYHLPRISVGSLVVADAAIPVPILLAQQTHGRRRMQQGTPGGKQRRVQIVAPRNALVHPQGALMVLILGHVYFLTASSIPGPAFARSAGAMAGCISMLALNARNHGSAIAGICDTSCISKTMNPVLIPSQSQK